MSMASMVAGSGERVGWWRSGFDEIHLEIGGCRGPGHRPAVAPQGTGAQGGAVSQLVSSAQDAVVSQGLGPPLLAR